MPLKSAKKPARKPAQKPAKKAKTKAPAKKKSAGKTASKRQIQKTAAPARKPAAETDLLKRVLASLNDDKAENVITIDLRGRSALCDAAVIASGRSSRHVGAMAEHLARRLKESGYGTRPVSGQAQGDWVLVDAGDVIVHLFRPEVRDYYDLEGMWSVGSRK
ncbi:MAG TPA: ribosome silencing factor [Rhizomicrobium sp.]